MNKVVIIDNIKKEIWYRTGIIPLNRKDSRKHSYNRPTLVTAYVIDLKKLNVQIVQAYGYTNGEDLEKLKETRPYKISELSKNIEHIKLAENIYCDMSLNVPGSIILLELKPNPMYNELC